MITLFIDLIRLSIGVTTTLSRTPSAEEWNILYKMSAKQALLGVCFAGVRRYMEIAHQNDEDVTIPQKIYHQWLGVAARIQQWNERMNRRCVEFELRLLENGFRSCVLKGQGLAALYGELSELRQPGDIDTWAIGTTNDVITWARGTGAMTFYDYHHADISIFKDVEIELHYRPSLSRNLLRNARLQKWFEQEGEKHIVFKDDLGFSVPDYVFNVVLTLNHNFWHLMYEGVGMRQILDLYVVLRSVGDNREQEQENAMKLIKYFRLWRFASASMWIMKEVFGLEERYLLCQPDAKAGSFLLDEIMQSGNFGKYDKRLNKNRYQSRSGLMHSWMKHNLRLLKFYPSDVLWTPIGVLRISLWRRWHCSKETNVK